MTNEETIEKLKELLFMTGYKEALDLAIKAIKNERPKGKWIAADLTFGRSFYSCTICDKTENVPTCMNKPTFKFCPNCGAELEVDNDPN